MSLQDRWLVGGMFALALAIAGCGPAGTTLVPVGEGSPSTVVMAPSPAPTATPYASPLLGQAAPTLAFVGLDGQSSSVEAFKGKKVLLTFFAYWCPHCQAELPKFQAYAQQRPELAFVPVEASSGPKGEVENFAKTYAMTVPLYYDESGAIAKAYGVNRYPLSFLLDADGRVRTAFSGARSDDELTALFAQF